MRFLGFQFRCTNGQLSIKKVKPKAKSLHVQGLNDIHTQAAYHPDLAPKRVHNWDFPINQVSPFDTPFGTFYPITATASHMPRPDGFNRPVDYQVAYNHLSTRAIAQKEFDRVLLGGPLLASIYGREKKKSS